MPLVYFSRLLNRYPELVPDKLRELDQLRLETIPASLQQRAKNGDAYLTKGEVLQLMEWKLKHGTFRPGLLNRVASNSSEAVESTTRAAFYTYANSTGSSESGVKTSAMASMSHPPLSTLIAALNTLTTLNGIGPATASLLLSTLAPASVPFFSDELFRFLRWETGGPTGSRGWGRKIAYSGKEYADLAERAWEVCARLGGYVDVGVRELEAVAWVLGKEEIVLDQDSE
ncbi:hypothetical protein BDY21DRAFT_278557, partial [Lineolata rhizophorae]